MICLTNDANLDARKRDRKTVTSPLSWNNESRSYHFLLSVMVGIFSLFFIRIMIHGKKTNFPHLPLSFGAKDRLGGVGTGIGTLRYME